MANSCWKYLKYVSICRPEDKPDPICAVGLMPANWGNGAIVEWFFDSGLNEAAKNVLLTRFTEQE